jgi:hypothetical protein
VCIIKRNGLASMLANVIDAQCLGVMTATELMAELTQERQSTPCQQQQGKAPASVDAILADPAASYWLKDAIRASLNRDALDAYRDACTLKDIAQARYAFATIGE